MTVIVGGELPVKSSRKGKSFRRTRYLSKASGCLAALPSESFSFPAADHRIGQQRPQGVFPGGLNVFANKS